MRQKTTLRELAETAGGYYIRATGSRCLVRWPDNTGGEVRTESRETLEAACDELDAIERMRPRS